jgi:hypothetical protein
MIYIKNAKTTELFKYLQPLFQMVSNAAITDEKEKKKKCLTLQLISAV